MRATAASWAILALLAGCVAPELDQAVITVGPRAAKPAAAASLRPAPPVQAASGAALPLPVPQQVFATPEPVAETVAAAAAVVVPAAAAAAPAPAPTAAATATPGPVATATPAPVATATPTPLPTATATVAPAARPDPLALFAEGVRRDLAGANQYAQFQALYVQLTPGQKESIIQLVESTDHTAGGVFVLKALTAGEPWANVTAYAREIEGVAEATVIAKSTMRDDMDLIQQWSDSCGPALLQTITGEVDPRYAWELNKAFDVARIDPYGVNRALAEQQKEWLERYGGVAVPRGATGGVGIPIGAMLNENLAAITQARYDHIEVTNVDAALTRVAGILQAGYDVPLRLSWSPPGSSADSGHFLLAIHVRGAGRARELQIHDPYTGKTAWVSQANLEAASFAPIFSDYARFTHYYEPTPLP